MALRRVVQLYMTNLFEYIDGERLNAQCVAHGVDCARAGSMVALFADESQEIVNVVNSCFGDDVHLHVDDVDKYILIS